MTEIAPQFQCARRRVLELALGSGLMLAGCRNSPELAGIGESARSGLATRIDEALARAAVYLVSGQSSDGAWRGSMYGFMKDGPSLSPHMLACLSGLRQYGNGVDEAFNRGTDYLASLVGRDGTIPGDLNLIFPVYTAAEAVRVLSRVPKHADAQAVWLTYLRSHQITEELGWSESDVEYGGWGYALHPPHKPVHGRARGPWDFSNLSATVYGLMAMKAAQLPATDKVYSRAMVFIPRCQNLSENPIAADASFDDGGFFFSPAEALRNKAGLAGRDSHGRPRFNSYGGATADGLRALSMCGVPGGDRRVRAARHWLIRGFSADHNPGKFDISSEDLRDATYYYYCCAAADAMQPTGDAEAHKEHGIDAAGWTPLRALLARALLFRQRPDGSWLNRFSDAREDDPLVATSLAASALAALRRMLT